MNLEKGLLRMVCLFSLYTFYLLAGWGLKPSSLGIDGIGLACGILEHLLNLTETPKVIAATHFHEIFENGFLAPRPKLQLGHMEVRVSEEPRDVEDQITYLYKSEHLESLFFWPNAWKELDWLEHENSFRLGRSDKSFGTMYVLTRYPSPLLTSAWHLYLVKLCCDEWNQPKHCYPCKRARFSLCSWWKFDCCLCYVICRGNKSAGRGSMEPLPNPKQLCFSSDWYLCKQDALARRFLEVNMSDDDRINAGSILESLFEGPGE